MICFFSNSKYVKLYGEFSGNIILAVANSIFLSIFIFNHPEWWEGVMGAKEIEFLFFFQSSPDDKIIDF